MTEERSRRFTEEFRVNSAQLVDKTKELIHEGNVRHIRIEQNGKTVLEIPLTFVAVGVLLAPFLAALSVFAALVTDCTIAVERGEGPTVPKD